MILFKKSPIVLLLILLFNLLINFPGLCQEQYNFSVDENINISVYEKVAPCVVMVMADIKQGASSGTGVIIDPSGVILTSKHVIGEAQKVKISVPSGYRYSADVIAITGKNDDLAILKINPVEKLQFARLGDSNNVKVGQKVLAIGNPFGFERTLTTGIISRIDPVQHRIQTDAAINSGCSGGPLLNSLGEVIGINQSIYNPDNTKSNIGISFAVPVNTAKSLLKNLNIATRQTKKDIEKNNVLPDQYKEVSSIIKK